MLRATTKERHVRERSSLSTPGRATLGRGVLLGTLLFAILAAGANGCAGTRGPSIVPPQSVEIDQHLLAKFRDEVDEYVLLRKKALTQVPALPDKATPEQVGKHEKALTDAIIVFRQGAKQGDIFKPDVAAAILHVLQRELSGPDGEIGRAHV